MFPRDLGGLSLLVHVGRRRRSCQRTARRGGWTILVDGSGLCGGASVVFIQVYVVLIEEVINVHDGKLGVVEGGERHRLVPDLGAQEGSLWVVGTHNGLSILENKMD